MQADAIQQLLEDRRALLTEVERLQGLLQEARGVAKIWERLLKGLLDESIKKPTTKEANDAARASLRWAAEDGRTTKEGSDGL
jgi:hypothetical protein